MNSPISTFFLLVVALFAAVVYSSCPSSSKYGWTYQTTKSTCGGTSSNDQCGIPYWYKVCNDQYCAGKSQSPIDFNSVAADITLTAPVFSGGGCRNWNQFVNNYTFEVAFNDASNLCTSLNITYQGTSYTLTQIHFHSPSEHSIGGGYYSAEAHLVHQSAAKHLLVVGVFLQVSSFQSAPSNNTFFNTLWNAGNGTMEKIVDVEVKNHALLNPYKSLLPGRQTFYTYNGSLTVPPCSENVRWIVMDEPVPISMDDLTIMRNGFAYLDTTVVSANGNNNRVPQQSINGRQVSYYSGIDMSMPMPMPMSMDDDNNNNNDDTASTSLTLGAIAFSISVVALLLVIVMYLKVSKLSQAPAAGPPSVAMSPMAK